MMGLWFGPLSQRIIALGLAVLVVLLALQWVVMPLMAAMTEGRAELMTLRERRAMLISAKTWPGVTPPPAAAAHWLLRGRAADLRRQVTAQMQAQAGSHGVTLSAVTVEVPGASNPDGGQQMVSITLAASGPQDAMLRWIAAIERGTTVMRAKTLRLQPIAGRDGTLSLDAVFLAMAVVS